MGSAFVLGIDIGTSFTAAAVGRRRADGSMEIESLELGSRRTAVPTVLFLGDDGGVLVGEAAERRAIDQPERVVREFKRRIGDQTPIIVGELSVAPEDIFAILAQWVVERAEQQEGEAPAVIALSHPASWGAHRLGLVRAALAGVGLGDVELVSEPEAAGLHYLGRQKVDCGAAIAVYDLGGGTFDVALLRMQGDEAFQLIGAPAGIEHLGGADFDQRIFEHVRSLAGDAFHGLDESEPDDALALARVRRDCVDAKEALSFDAETVVPVLLSSGQTRVRLVRAEFEHMIAADLGRTVETLRSAVAAAELELADLSTVLLIGGSSRIPAVAQLISVELELPVAVDTDPKAAISLGAAAAASRCLVPPAVESPDEGSDPPHEDAVDSLARAGAPVGIAAAASAHGMSVGVRATVLAGVAAALIAILIPVTPLAIGTQQQPGEDDSNGSTADVDGAPAGVYVTGEAPLVELPPDPVFEKPDPVFERERAAGGTDARVGDESPASPIRSSPTADDAPSEQSSANVPTPDPTAGPVPTVDPAPDPEPDPTPDPVPEPDPTPDPVPEPDPVPDPEPTPDPVPEPDPTPAPTGTPDPAQEPTAPLLSES